MGAPRPPPRATDFSSLWRATKKRPKMGAAKSSLNYFWPRELHGTFWGHFGGPPEVPGLPRPLAYDFDTKVYNCRWIPVFGLIGTFILLSKLTIWAKKSAQATTFLISQSSNTHHF